MQHYPVIPCRSSTASFCPKFDPSGDRGHDGLGFFHTVRSFLQPACVCEQHRLVVVIGASRHLLAGWCLVLRTYHFFAPWLCVLDVICGARTGLRYFRWVPSSKQAILLMPVCRHVNAGNTAAAAFNAVLGNLLGVVVTPALLVLLVGRRLDMAPSLLATFKKLGIKVRESPEVFFAILSYSCTCGDRVY